MLPNIEPKNLDIKQYVGEFIYDIVEEIVGEELAPKITGMLIDLPLKDIREYLADYKRLKEKVFEAKEILRQV